MTPPVVAVSNGAAETIVEPVAIPEPAANSKALLAAAKLPERRVPLCLRADLQAEYEDLERQLLEAVAQQTMDQRLNSGGEAKRIAEAVEALQQQMRDSTLVVRMRARSRRRWDELMKEHPARKDVDEDQVLGYNPDTLFDAAIRECTFEPADLDEADWTDLLDEKITAFQYKQLVDAVMTLNVRKVDVPNSRAASRILRGSDSG